MTTEILAPMPGTIFQVHIKPGDSIVEGQELLVLEAMKMENPIIANTSGRVKEILIKPGDKVATKQLLLVIE